MKPVKRKERTAFQNGPKVHVASVKDERNSSELSDLDSFVPSDEETTEDDTYSFVEGETKKMTDEEIKIKALKQATDIAKLMSDVTTDDVLDIAAKVALYIKEG